MGGDGRRNGPESGLSRANGAAARPRARWAAARGEAADGALAILPLLVSAVPIGLLLGALAAQAGLSTPETVLMSGLVFAGGAQFVALDLWASPLPVLAIVATTAAINLRHVLMGATLASDLSRWGLGPAHLGLFPLTDETWALGLRRRAERPLTPAFWAGMCVPFWLGWMLTTAVGSVTGSLLDDPSRWGFDFAFPAVFLVLLAGLWRGRASIAPVAASAAVAVAASLWLPGAWSIVLGGLAGAAAGAATAPASGPAPARDGEMPSGEVPP